MSGKIRTRFTSALALTAVCIAFPALAEIEYDAYVVEPWDDSYQYATSFIGDINDHNVAVGSAYLDGTETSAFFWTLEEGKVAADIGASEINNEGVTASGTAIWWAPGDYELLPHPDGGFGVGIRDLSNNNRVCGTGAISERTKAFYWDETSGSVWLEDLGVPPTTWRAYAVNDAGLLAGSRSLTGEPGDEKCFVLDVPGERLIDLHEILGNPPNSGITTAVDVSESGFVTGDGSHGNGIAGFLWSEADGVTLLPGLGGGLAMDVHPSAVNDAGTVVGGALDAEWEWRAFVWDAANGIRDLENLADLPDGFNLQEATGINENGWIIARGFWGQAWGPQRAVVFIPRTAPAAAPQADARVAGPTIRILRTVSGGGVRIALRIPDATPARLDLYDVAGRRVAGLLDRVLPIGEHEVRWDGTTRLGRSAPAGVFFVRLETDQGPIVKRFVRLPSP
ncbi:MAG: hypothetical protein GF346_07820 [Candidatus Eisenbacteria bacterium]|nr:hypothetical protein [Candidatus Latescibacterota bacterium]MBD3302340.1 hypothetical protein [Candidatus Eisenbacteria bacterium]